MHFFKSFVVFLLINTPAIAQICDSSGPGLARRGNTLCWNSEPVRLIGYSALDTITRNNFDYERYFKLLQYVPRENGEGHGVNLTRIWAMGWHNAPEGCRTPAEADPARPLTRMPFSTIGENCSARKRFPKYDLWKLDSSYLAHLKRVLNAARKNGIVVELTLFDHYHLLKSAPNSTSPLYSANPWNPVNNNLYENDCKILPRSRKKLDTDGLPEFFDICRDTSDAASCNASLNCLGRVQKNYVQEIVKAVKANGNDHVFFEIMNEADGAPALQLALWHDVVGSWIKDEGDFLVSANSSSDEVSQRPNIDIVTLHASSWIPMGPCKAASAAIARFGKPVIIDTDGNASIPQRNDNCIVKEWAEATSYCRPEGQAHFNQLDGMTIRNTRMPCNFNPARNRAFHETLLDCHTLDALGDVGPTRLSDIITEPGAASCPHFRSQNWCAATCN